MAKLKRKERRVHLECTVCKERNYTTDFVMKGGQKLEISKYCPRCRKHTPHKSRKID